MLKFFLSFGERFLFFFMEKRSNCKSGWKKSGSKEVIVGRMSSE